MSFRARRPCIAYSVYDISLSMLTAAHHLAVFAVPLYVGALRSLAGVCRFCRTAGAWWRLSRPDLT